MRTLLFLLILLLFSSGVSAFIDFQDSYPSIVDNPCGNDCGDRTDEYMWVDDYGCWWWDGTQTYLDVICVDVRNDGDLESCIYFDSDKMDDCIAQYVAVDDVPSARNFDVGGASLDGHGWGVQDCAVDIANNSLGAPFIISPDPAFAGMIDSSLARTDLQLNFYQYFDCDDSSGERNVDTRIREAQVFSHKTSVCGAGDGARINGVNGGTNLLYDYPVCYSLDEYSGEDISSCDPSKMYDTTSRNLWMFNGTIPYCALNYTIRDDYLASKKYNCYNGVLDTNLNETEVDYGGWCGNCSPVFADDVSFLLGAVSFDAENGKRNFDNPFDSSFCPVGEAVGVVPIIIFISTFGIGILLLFIAGLVFIIYVIAISLLTSGIKLFIENIKKKRNK